MLSVGSLIQHGFLDIPLSADFSNICELLPHAQEIARLGSQQDVNGEPWQFLTRALDISGRHIGWHIGDLHSEGTYGKIFKAHRMAVQRRADGVFNVTEAAHRVIVKQTHPPTGSTILPAEDVAAHTSEALLHVLAWHTIRESATPWGIPRPYEVFGERAETSVSGWRTMSFCMSYVRGKTLHKYLQRHWQPNRKRENALLLLDLLAQVAYILWHLQQHIQLNHRDLKINNILISRRATPVTLSLDGITFDSHHEVTLIDFGFACVGCPPPRAPATVLQSGCWFELRELCCKAGRDIAQLLFCIHCYYPLDIYLPSVIADEIREWLQIPWSGGVADALQGFTREGRPKTSGRNARPEYDAGIYQFLRRTEVDPVACAPVRVFNEAVRLKEILTHMT
jgi:serine/threonine protein kinase